MSTSFGGPPTRVGSHQLGVSPVVQYDVLGFQVSVDDPSGVQEAQRLDHAACVEAGDSVVKGPPETEEQPIG